MALIVWPLLVYAYYKQKYTLKNWLLIFAILIGVAAVLASGEYIFIVLVAHIVGIAIVFLSARFTAWCIRRHVNRKKTKITSTNDNTELPLIRKRNALDIFCKDLEKMVLFLLNIPKALWTFILNRVREVGKAFRDE